MNGKAIDEEHHTGSDNDQPSSTEPPWLPPAEHTPPNGHQRRSRRYCHIRFEWPKLALEILTLGVIIFYAYQAERQASGTQKAANAARDAARAVEQSNLIAHDNSVTDLRAYITIGGPKLTPVEIKIDKRKHIVNSIVVNFFNAGRTPASHVAINIWNPVISVHGQPLFLERYKMEPDNAIYSISALGQSVIPPNTVFSETLLGQMLPSANLFKQIDAKDSKNTYVVSGTVSYCDVFGVFRCDTFAYRYSPNTAGHFEPWITVGATCDITPERRPSDNGIWNGKPVVRNYVPLRRCEQPKELMVDQGGKDEAQK